MVFKKPNALCNAGVPIKNDEKGRCIMVFLRCVNRGRNLTRSTKGFYLQHLNVLLQVPGGCGTKSTKITHRCGWWMVDADGVSESSRPRCLSYVQGSFSSIDNIEIYFIACFGFIFFHLQRVKYKGNPCSFFF